MRKRLGGVIKPIAILSQFSSLSKKKFPLISCSSYQIFSLLQKTLKSNPRKIDSIIVLNVRKFTKNATIEGLNFAIDPLNNHEPEPSSQSSRFSKTIFERYAKLIRGIQTQAEAHIHGTKVAEKAEVASSKVKPLSDIKADVVKGNSEVSVSSSGMSNLKVSSRHDLAMVFTCKVYETRSVKTCCRDSYENGIVVVRCGGCNNLHLMADRLGWFGEPGSIEDLLATHGDVKRDSIDSLNLSLEDLAGKKL